LAGTTFFGFSSSLLSESELSTFLAGAAFFAGAAGAAFLMTGTSSSLLSESLLLSFFAAAFLATATGAFLAATAALGWILTSSLLSESLSSLETGAFLGTGLTSFLTTLEELALLALEVARGLLSPALATTGFFFISSSEEESLSEELSTTFFF
jgi:hypothetical protein